MILGVHVVNLIVTLNLVTGRPVTQILQVDNLLCVHNQIRVPKN